MSDTPMALEVCLCGQCATKGHPQEHYRPLTAEEIAQREADAAAFEAQQAEAEAAASAKQAEREAVLAKLGLTAAEAALLLG